MRATVVYESSFGNTRKLAEAIAQALGADLLSVEEPMPDLEELDLIVVGAPTHVHGVPSSRSRQAAIDQGGDEVAAERGVREWLEALPDPPEHLRAAAFDTRLDKPMFLTGSAAKGIAKRLDRKGYPLIAPPESFLVHGTSGPVADGELPRAVEWAQSLSRATRQSARPREATAQPA
jgi:hypothetical protein